MSKTQRHRQEPDRRPCDKHITSLPCCRQTGLLTSANNNARDLRGLFDSVVRRRCQRTLRSLASRKDAPPINPTQLVNAHVCSSRVLAVSPIAGLLILPSSPVCELDALRVARMHARALVLAGMDHGCLLLDVCAARKHSYPSRWPGRPERHVARSFSRPCTRVDRLERMSISVAISRWADVRVTMVRGRALSWASSCISNLFSCTPAQSRAASNPFALATRA